MRRGTPNQLIHELIDKIDELKSEGVESSAVVVDDGTDVIEAEDDVVVDDESVSPEIEYDSIGEDDYIHHLYSSVEDELSEMAEGISWNSDDDNIFMDVSFSNGQVITFTIPKVDLTFNFDDVDKDIQYICVAVKDSHQMEEEESLALEEPENIEDTDAPAYL